MGMIGGIAGAGVNTVIGGIATLINNKKQKKYRAEIEQKIKETPDFRDSEAYGQAASEAGKADRYAQEGLTSQQTLNATQGAEQAAMMAVSNAGTVGASLAGGRMAQQTLGQNYSQIAEQDSLAQMRNRGLAQTANQNLFTAQESAYGVDLAKQNNLLDLKLAEAAASKASVNQQAANVSESNKMVADAIPV